jgi:MarR family 2-MHQ and catechol resistance regulon transcriptional repressor
MSRKQTNLSEIVSLVFVMGRFMRDKVHKNIKSGPCGSLLEFETLRYIQESKHPQMRDVANNFHVTPPAATLLIDSLVKGKLIVRSLDAKDRRSVRIALTKKGKEFLERDEARRTSEFKKIFGILTPAERTEFAALLKKIIKNNI